MSQPDLIDLMTQPPRQNWRSTDPDTSREAGVAAIAFKGDDQKQIFTALTVASKPMAAEQISDMLGWNNHVRVNRRLKELAEPVFDEYGALVRRALIERTEEKHTNKSGRAAYRYKVRKTE